LFEVSNAKAHLFGAFVNFFRYFFAGSEKSCIFAVRKLVSAPQFLGAKVYSGSIPERFAGINEREVQVETLLGKTLTFSTGPGGGGAKAQIRN
jgi:hypothetical protein